MDIVFKPRIWDHGTLTFSFEAQPTFQITAAGRVATPPTLIPPHASITSTLESEAIFLPIALRLNLISFSEERSVTGRLHDVSSSPFSNRKSSGEATEAKNSPSNAPPLFRPH